MAMASLTWLCVCCRTGHGWGQLQGRHGVQKRWGAGQVTHGWGGVVLVPQHFLWGTPLWAVHLSPLLLRATPHPKPSALW